MIYFIFTVFITMWFQFKLSQALPGDELSKIRSLTALVYNWETDRFVCFFTTLLRCFLLLLLFRFYAACPDFHLLLEKKGHAHRYKKH